MRRMNFRLSSLLLLSPMHLSIWTAQHCIRVCLLITPCNVYRHSFAPQTHATHNFWSLQFKRVLWSILATASRRRISAQFGKKSAGFVHWRTPCAILITGCAYWRRLCLWMEKGKLWPPIESTPLNRSRKICYRWLKRRLLPLSQIWCKSVLCGNGLNITKIVFTNLFIPLSWTQLQVRPVNGFSRLMAQTTQNQARMSFLWSQWLCYHFWIKFPKNHVGCIRHFQAKPAKT